jgi:hypothetical protein
VAAPDGPFTGALTGVFAPGAPPLPEALRTLVVTPRRTASPGELIRVEFTFSNLGGASATNVRVRFAHPSGVSHVEGSDTLDDAPVERASLVAAAGTLLGDLPPNGQRRVACSFRVNERIEDGTNLVFQAALVTDQTPLIASNVERITVRSSPQLQNTSTIVTIAAPAQPKPGDAITVRATIANTGSSSAHDVLAFLPVPAHTKYVARSARIAGRALAERAEEPFDYATEQIVSKLLTAGQSVDVEYQAAIDAPLPDGTRIKVLGAVSAREVSEFPMHSAEIVVSSPPEFTNAETAMTVFCDDVVSPGTRIPISVRAFNTGTGDAHDVSIEIALPQGVAYTAGSAHVDSQPVSDEMFTGGVFSIGTVPAGRAAEAGISGVAVVQSAEEIPVTATLRWRPSTSSGPVGERKFTRLLRVRVSSRFTRVRNYLEADRAVAQAREDVTFTARVFNDGTAVEPDVRLRVIPGAFFEHVRIAEAGQEPATYDEPFLAGAMQPQSERTFIIVARVGSPVPDRAQLTLGAVLDFAAGTFDLGVANLIVRSRPHVAPESCTWLREQSEALRPTQTHELTIRFTNDGPDVLRDARLELHMPPELVLERAQNARREGSSLLFGDIPAESTHEARVAVRLARAPKREPRLTIEGTLYGRGISPVRFDDLEIPTFAEPEFARDAQLRSNPGEAIKAGERVAYEVLLRNSGDGPAEHVVLRAVPSNLAVYAPGSTQLNGLTIPDDLGTSQLWSQRGLALTDVNPGLDLRVRWEMLVISPIAAGTPIETRVVVEWDGNHSMALAAPPLHVLSSPSLEAGAAGTPISLARLVSPALEAPRAEEIVPPQAAEAEEEAAAEETAALEVLPAPPPPEPEPEPGPTVYVDFTQDQLVQALRTLEMSNAGGLIAHIFAIRALFPNAIAGADTQFEQIAESAARAIREPLDRLFVRLRAPRLTITAKDLEDRESRFALRSFVDALLEAPVEELGELEPRVVRLSGRADPHVLRRSRAQLDSAPLGSVTPWIAGAHLLGTSIEFNGGRRSGVLEQYRAELIKVFGVLETLPIPEFHRVLTSSVNRTLDEGLGAVVEALRSTTYSLS